MASTAVIFNCQTLDLRAVLMAKTFPLLGRSSRNARSRVAWPASSRADSSTACRNSSRNKSLPLAPLALVSGSSASRQMTASIGGSASAAKLCRCQHKLTTNNASQMTAGRRIPLTPLMALTYRRGRSVPKRSANVEYRRTLGLSPAIGRGQSLHRVLRPRDPVIIRRDRRGSSSRHEREQASTPCPAAPCANARRRCSCRS